MCSRWAELMPEVGNFREKNFSSIQSSNCSRYWGYLSRSGWAFIKDIVKDHSPMNLKVLLAWRLASCVWNHLLAFILNRCPGLKGSRLDRWHHALHHAAGNSDMFWSGYERIKPYGSPFPTWTKAGTLDRQKSIPGSLPSYMYGDLSVDLDGICWQDHFLYWIFFLTVASPKGFQPRWSQPR